MCLEKVSTRSLGKRQDSDTEGKNEQEMGRTNEQKSQETWGKSSRWQGNSGCSWSRVKSRIEDNEEIYAMVTMAFPRWHTHSSQTSLRLLLLLLSKTMPCSSMLFSREGALQLTSEPSVPYALTLVSDTLAHPLSL